MASLVRRRIPGLAISQENMGGTITFMRSAPRPEAPLERRPCFALAHPLKAGALVTGDDLLRVSCISDTKPAALRYDGTNGTTRAGAPLDAGSYVGPLVVPHHHYADRGDNLVLGVSIGPVRIERQVFAMQPAAAGSDIFVRDEDGNVFSAPIAKFDDDRRAE
jgi:hypothetical protein